MSFLDRINAMKAKKAAEEAAAAKQASQEPQEAPKEEPAKAPEHKPVNDVIARLKAKRAAAAKTVEDTEPAQKAKAEEKKPAVKEVPKAEEKEETSLQAKAEAVMNKILEEPVKIPDEKETAVKNVKPVEEPKKEEKTPEAKEAPKAEAKEDTEEKSVEKKATVKKADPKKASKKPAAGEGSDVHAAQFASGYDVLGSKMDFDQMADIVLNYFEKDDWKETEAAYNKALSEVRIEGDMNTGTLRYALADLNNLNDEITQEYDKANKLLQTLTDHDFGAATAVQAMGAVGSNSEERKRNGFIALTKGKIDGHDVNYIALVSAARCRQVGLSSLLKRVQFKANICITMLGALKTELTLMNGVERKDAKIA